MRVFVYYNLHKKTWSIRALEGPQRGLVVAHRDTLWLTSVTPRVSQKGRERVLREGRKNVHAGLVGQWDPMAPIVDKWPTGDWQSITYNPYKYIGFVYKENESPYSGSHVAYMAHRQVEVLK